MQFYAPDIQKPGRKEEEKDGGRKMEGWKEGGREGKKKRKEKKGRKGIFFLFFSKSSRKITLPKSDEISLVSVPVVNARNLAVEEYLLIS